jgi:hypothetical protein
MDIQKTIAALEYWGGNFVDLHCGMMSLGIPFGRAMLIPEREKNEPDEKWIARVSGYMLDCLIEYHADKLKTDAYDAEVKKIPVPEKVLLIATTAQIEEPIKP